MLHPTSEDALCHTFGNVVDRELKEVVFHHQGPSQKDCGCAGRAVHATTLLFFLSIRDLSLCIFFLQEDPNIKRLTCLGGLERVGMETNGNTLYQWNFSYDLKCVT